MSRGCFQEEDMTKLAVKLQGRIWFEHDGEYILGPGVVRLIYAVTPNCWSKASKLQLDPAPSQNLFRYAELKDGTIRDITRYIKFRNEKAR